MKLNLENKVVMVVGATRGFGRSCASIFAEEGSKLALIARDSDELKEVSKEARAVRDVPIQVFPSDFMNPDDPPRVVAEIVERFGKIDALVNTIGVCNSNPDGDPLAAEAMWEDAFQSVLMAAVRSCRAVVPVMKENGGGAIVNTSAMSARHYLPSIAHYSALKAAVAHFTKNLAIHYGKDNIRANIVLPGWIMSEQVEAIFDRYAEDAEMKGKSRQEIFDQMNEDIDRVTFCGRGGEPDEYARVAAFLCSEAASYVSGAWVNVDGGSMF